MAQGAATETPEKPSKGRKHGQKDYSFEERLRLLDWAIDSSIIARDRDFWVNKNPGGPRTFNIPWQSQQPHVSVDTLLDWARAADIQQWREMIKEMPKLDWGKRSRIPSRWEKLDAGMSRLGQPALLTKHPDLLPALESVDELHKRERVISKNQPRPNPSTKHFRQRWGFVAVKVIVCQQRSADPGSNFG